MQNLRWAQAFPCTQSTDPTMTIAILALSHSQKDQVAQCSKCAVIKGKPHPPLRIYVEPDQMILVSLDTAYLGMPVSSLRMKKGKRAF